MNRRSPNDERPRRSGRPDHARAGQDRVRIAQTAARLIALHGLTDWALAKRKAARELMLPEGTAFPSNDEIEAALADYHALFAADTHPAALRVQREAALTWMRRLAAWDPVLVGGVAAGWATEHSDVRLELCADDPKAVEIALAGEGIGYSILPERGATEPARTVELRIDDMRASVRLSILTETQRRNRPRRPGEQRIDAGALTLLLEARA